jgi:hypothetical protein
VTGVTFGEERPALLPRAETICILLELERALGLLPPECVFRLYVVADSRLVIAVGGLSNRFLLGTHDTQAEQAAIAEEFYTGAALRLWREIHERAYQQLPRTASDAAWFQLVVWLQPEPWWHKAATTHPEGVIVVEQDGPQ